MKAVKLVLKSLGGLLAIYMVYFYYSLATAEGRVRPFCESIKPGTTFSQLAKISKDNGMSTPTQNGGFGYIVERRSFGRYGCEIRFESGVVVRSKYHFHD